MPATGLYLREPLPTPTHCWSFWALAPASIFLQVTQRNLSRTYSSNLYIYLPSFGFSVCVSERTEKGLQRAERSCTLPSAGDLSPADAERTSRSEGWGLKLSSEAYEELTKYIKFYSKYAHVKERCWRNYIILLPSTCEDSLPGFSSTLNNLHQQLTLSRSQTITRFLGKLCPSLQRRIVFYRRDCCTGSKTGSHRTSSRTINEWYLMEI
jgi:hypothetical protein